MTITEWICFIVFTIIINILFQTIAWKIGYWLGKAEEGTNDKRR